MYEVFQGMDQLSSRIDIRDIATFNVASELKWQQEHHDLSSIPFLATFGSTNNFVKTFGGK